MSWRVTSSYEGAAVSDSDAQTYLRAVEQADQQPLEVGVQQFINQFVIDCKASGVWTPMKSCCILAGARTLDGALIPLKGTAPTNFNFVSGDYNRKTGLVGNGSTKYLDSNRNNNADPQNSQHLVTYVTTISSIGPRNSYYIGSSTASGGASSYYRDGTQGTQIMRSRSTGSDSFGVANPGLIGINRSAANSYQFRYNQVSHTLLRTSETPLDSTITVFGADSGSASTLSNARISFYSIGENINMDLLESRILRMMNSLSAII